MAHWIESEIERWSKRLPAGRRVLDVGCGLKPYDRYFASHRYIALDALLSGRTASAKSADVFYDGHAFPFGNASFDVVLFTEVLEHCDAPDLVVSEIARVLATEGFLCLTVPFIWGEHELPYDFQRYTLFGLGKILARHGLRVAESKRLVQGIDAIEVIVRSEIGNFETLPGNRQLVDGADWRRRWLSSLADWLWRLQVKLWRRLYRFERLYLGNFVIAQKLPDRTGQGKQV